MTGKNVEIRPFRPADYDSVLALWAICGLPYKPHGRDSREKVLKEIKQETATFLVATNEEKVIGTVLATHDGRKGWINRLAVDPDFRRLGIALLLLEKAEEAIHGSGIEIIACLIEDYNQGSMDFFQKMNYEKHTDIIYFSKRQHIDV